MLKFIATVPAAYFDWLFLMRMSALYKGLNNLLAEKEAVSKLLISTGGKRFLTDIFVKFYPSNFILWLALKRGLEWEYSSGETA